MLREILKRWPSRSQVATSVDDGTCAATTLLEELAADGEDFADLAAVLRVDMRDVVATLVSERPTDAAALLTALAVRTARATAAGDDATTTAAVAPATEVVAPRSTWASWGGGGWGLKEG